MDVLTSEITLSFFAFLALFTGVGIYAASRKQATTDDYLLASRQVRPWLVALSAVATQNSGFMFIGLTGTAYAHGVKEAVWWAVGWLLGDWVGWLLVHRRVRERSEVRGVRTIPELLGGDMRGGRVVVVLAALITLVFLGLYASAQFTAGRKALEQFGIDAWLGVILGAGMVAVYCFSGGIRASIWTDAAQSIVMFGAMALLVGVGLGEVGGPGALWDRLEAIDPKLVSWTQGASSLGMVAFVLSWAFGGFGMIGQPHLMIRLMTLDSAGGITSARRMYITYFTLFTVACVLVGLLARVLLAPDAGAAAAGGQGFDAELAFPLLADHLLPGILVGVMLAGVFAATVSTADSQVLSCSAAITQDLAPGLGRSYTVVKIGTLAVTAGAATMAMISLSPDSFMAGVFDLVLFAWTGLASSLGPLLVVRAFGGRINAPLAVIMMLAGLGTVLVWDLALGLGGQVYAAMPGILAGFVTYAIGRGLVPAREE